MRKRPLHLRVLGRLRDTARRLLGYERVLFFHAGTPTAPPRQPQRQKLRQIERETALRWSRERPGLEELSKAMLEMRFSQGHRLYAWLVDDKPVTIGWVSDVESFGVTELRGNCNFGGRFTLIWDCHTFAEHQRRGFYTTFLEHLKAATWPSPLIIFVRSRNTPSVTAIERAGFQLWTDIRISLLGVRILRPLEERGQVTYNAAKS